MVYMKVYTAPVVIRLVWFGLDWAAHENTLLRKLEQSSEIEGTAMKSGHKLGTSPKLFFIIRPCYQVQHGGYNEPKKDNI